MWSHDKYPGTLNYSYMDACCLFFSLHVVRVHNCDSLEFGVSSNLQARLLRSCICCWLGQKPPSEFQYLHLLVPPPTRSRGAAAADLRLFNVTGFKCPRCSMEETTLGCRHRSMITMNTTPTILGGTPTLAQKAGEGAEVRMVQTLVSPASRCSLSMIV